MLLYFLNKFKTANVIFQKDDTTSYELHKYLKDFFRSLANIILKPEFKRDKEFNFTKLYSINLEDNKEVEIYYMNSEECLSSFKKERFRNEVDWNLISPEKEVDFADDFREFILELLHQSKHYLPLKDNYIDLFKVLKPLDFDRECWIDLVDKFPNFFDKGHYSTFVDDLDKLESYDFSKLDSVRLCNYYQQWKRLGEDLELTYIHKISQTLLMIPVSTASLERIFSKLKFIKNPLRSSLSDSSLEACLLIQEESNITLSDNIIRELNKIHQNYQSKPSNSPNKMKEPSGKFKFSSFVL